MESAKTTRVWFWRWQSLKGNNILSDTPKTLCFLVCCGWTNSKLWRDYITKFLNTCNKWFANGLNGRIRIQSTRQSKIQKLILESYFQIFPIYLKIGIHFNILHRKIFSTFHQKNALIYVSKILPTTSWWVKSHTHFNSTKCHIVLYLKTLAAITKLATIADNKDVEAVMCLTLMLWQSKNWWLKYL